MHLTISLPAVRLQVAVTVTLEDRVEDLISWLNDNVPQLRREGIEVFALTLHGVPLPKADHWGKYGDRFGFGNEDELVAETRDQPGARADARAKTEPRASGGGGGAARRAPGAKPAAAFPRKEENLDDETRDDSGAAGPSAPTTAQPAPAAGGGLFRRGGGSPRVRRRPDDREGRDEEQERERERESRRERERDRGDQGASDESGDAIHDVLIETDPEKKPAPDTGDASAPRSRGAAPRRERPDSPSRLGGAAFASPRRKPDEDAEAGEEAFSDDVPGVGASDGGGPARVATGFPGEAGHLGHSDPGAPINDEEEIHEDDGSEEPPVYGLYGRARRRKRRRSQAESREPGLECASRGRKRSSEPRVVYTRRASVYYYRVMNPQATFPVNVHLYDPDAPPPAPGEGRDAAHGEKTHEMYPPESRLVVRVMMPGCLVTPDQEIVSVEPSRIRVDFHVTPVTNGPVKGSVRVMRGDEVLEIIPLDCVVRRRTVARVAVALGIAAPVFHILATLLRISEGRGAREIVDALLDFARSPLPVAAAGFFLAMLVAWIAHLATRPEARSTGGQKKLVTGDSPGMS